MPISADFLLFSLGCNSQPIYSSGWGGGPSEEAELSCCGDPGIYGFLLCRVRRDHGSDGEGCVDQPLGASHAGPDSGTCPDV